MYIIILTNMTQANKAQFYLNRMRIKNRIERVKSAGKSCSFGLRVYDDPYRVCQVLSNINVKCMEIKSA